MYNNFADYMWYLLTTPFKKVAKTKNQWYIYFKVIGKWFDGCLNDIYVAREETMIATCSQEMLPIHGADRRLIRYEGETWENFRYRIAMYEELRKLGGTNTGVLQAVRNVGFEHVSIEKAKHVTGDESRWAEFYLIFPFDLEEAYPIGIDVLKQEVRKTKEVAALDNYMFRFSSEAEQIIANETVLLIQSSFYPHGSILILDGSWKLDGKEMMIDMDADLYPVELNILSEVTQSLEAEAAVQLEHDLWYLDGAELLNGDRYLSAEIILSEL